ncbi:hypothetical protein D7X98_13300 [bacterium 1XD8-76]|nr:hypothetical protein D7X98_13300 [bacterium 1XD8-76]
MILIQTNYGEKRKSRESTFLIQDMFPITEEYIEREEIIAGNAGNGHFRRCFMAFGSNFSDHGIR